MEARGEARAAGGTDASDVACRGSPPVRCAFTRPCDGNDVTEGRSFPSGSRLICA